MAVELLGSGNDQIDYGDSGLGGATELTIAITMKPTAAIAARYLAQEWGSTDATQAWLLFVDASGRVQFGLKEAGLFSSTFLGRQTGTGVMVNGSLSRLVLRWRASAKAMKIASNGVDESVTTWLEDNSPATLVDSTNPMQIGHFTSDGADGLDGDYSEVAVWNRYLSDEDALALSSGFSPSFYRESGLLYSRLINTDDLGDVWGDRVGTGTGEANASHPSMIYPASHTTMLWEQAAAAKAAGPFTTQSPMGFHKGLYGDFAGKTPAGPATGNPWYYYQNQAAG